MRTVLIGILSLKFTLTAFSQDTLNRLELGISVLTVNTNYYPYFIRPNTISSKLQFINSLYFSYTLRRIALRAGVSYGDGTQVFERIFYVPITQYNKLLNAGIGAQLSLLKKQNWLYSFVDLHYTYILSETMFPSGELLKFKSNGIGADVGFGFRIKVYKTLYLSPELCYDLLFVKRNFTYRIPASYPYYIESSKLNRYENYSNGIGKLHLALKF